MTIDELIELYPAGKIQQAKAGNEYLSLPVDEKYFVLAKESLRETEIRLLEKLFPPKTALIDQEKHPWFRYLFNQATLETEGTFRIIQFQLKKPKAFLQLEWENSLREIFSHMADFFFIREDYGLLVERYAKTRYSLEELQSIFLTLDADFDSSTLVYVGNFFPVNETLRLLFQEEQQIFQEESFQRKYPF